MKPEEREPQRTENAGSIATSPAPAGRGMRGWQVGLLAILGLLVVTVGVEAWFVHDLRQKVIGLTQESPTASVGSAWDPREEEAPESLTGQDPFEQMQRIHEAMNRALNHSVGWFGTHPLMDLANDQPRMDIREEPDRFVVTADVPGATAGSVKVDLDGQRLTIEGDTETKSEKQSEDGRVLREEREAGVFSRSVTLPGSVASSGMKTEVHDGVLTITIPKLSKG